MFHPSRSSTPWVGRTTWRPAILLVCAMAAMVNGHDHHFEGAKGKWVSEEPIVCLLETMRQDDEDVRGKVVVLMEWIGRYTMDTYSPSDFCLGDTLSHRHGTRGMRPDLPQPRTQELTTRPPDHPLALARPRPNPRLRSLSPRLVPRPHAQRSSVYALRPRALREMAYAAPHHPSRVGSLSQAAP
jgi:hypothetical protein